MTAATARKTSNSHRKCKVGKVPFGAFLQSSLKGLDTTAGAASSRIGRRLGEALYNSAARLKMISIKRAGNAVANALRRVRHIAAVSDSGGKSVSDSDWLAVFDWAKPGRI